jgi:vacuolar-type H+-ATPase subunit D/Vma8
MVMLNIDKVLNDLLDILATLDGRVKRLELKKSIKRRPSYLNIVGAEQESSISDEIRLEQYQHSLTLLNKAVTTVSDRVDILEKDEDET